MKKSLIDIYKDGDEVGLNSLYNSVFNQDRNLREWEWKYLASPVDSRSFIIVAKDGEKIVGQYPSISLYLKYGDAIVRAVQPADNSVDKDYRGGAKGIQVQMFLKFEEVLRDNGIALAFGFPNREAYVIGKRLLKYTDLFKTEHLFKRLSWRLALRRRMNIPLLVDFMGKISRVIIKLSIIVKIRPSKGVQFRWVSVFDKRIDELWEKTSGHYRIMIKRDFKYLNWRYCKNPHNNYHILQAEKDGDVIGIIIVKYEDRDDTRIGFIMECIATKELYLMENLLKRGLIFLSRNKADYVLCMLSSGDPAKDIFCQTGFSTKEDIWDSKIVYKKYSSNVDDSVLQDPSMWHISFGDGCDLL
jgi:hypothetical protein